MDFIFDLPLANENHNVIVVVVDALTEQTRSIPMKPNHTAEDTALISYKETYKNYRVAKRIISDRDLIFPGHFCAEIMNILGVKLNLSTAFHPETDGRTVGKSMPYNSRDASQLYRQCTHRLGQVPSRT